MGVMSRFKKNNDGNETPSQDGKDQKEIGESAAKVLTPRVFAMIMIVSLGGLIFGYDTGQISGFLEMTDFVARFSDNPNGFGSVRSGLIVGLLSIGTLCGAVFGSPVADILGRKKAIITWNIMFIIGVVIQIATITEWYQIAIGRFVAGLGVGGLSVLTPMYQSETAPRQIRGAMVSCYQLFITGGIFLANVINLGTHDRNGPSQWRIPMGIGFVFPVIMIVGILMLDESPRWDYRKGNIERARNTIAHSYNVPTNHREVEREFKEIKAKFDAENANGEDHPWTEVFTGPRMSYRILLGMALQAFQQLTGANYFFYYGTTIFTAVGLGNAFVDALALSTINFGMTFFGVIIIEHVGRRKALIAGGIWQSMCFFIFASVGAYSLNTAPPGADTHTQGSVLIAFAALFIASYAITWAPMIWSVTAEIFPTRYRSTALGFTTGSNWIFNFIISFCTPFVVNKISFNYGYVFAVCNLLGSLTVWLFLCESRGRSLEEIDTMYLLHVSPRKSSKWDPPHDEEIVSADSLYLERGARGIRKTQSGNKDEKLEEVPDASKA